MKPVLMRTSCPLTIVLPDRPFRRFFCNHTLLYLSSASDTCLSQLSYLPLSHPMRIDRMVVSTIFTTGCMKTSSFMVFTVQYVPVLTISVFFIRLLMYCIEVLRPFC